MKFQRQENMKNTLSLDFENVQKMQNIKWFTDVTLTSLYYISYSICYIYLRIYTTKPKFGTSFSEC